MPSAKQALELLDDEAFDLVVSDVVMPEMTGVEFLYELRKRRLELPVVLMTGGSKEPERATKAVELGACSLIYKPFSNAELTDAVAAALERYERSRKPQGRRAAPPRPPRRPSRRRSPLRPASRLRARRGEVCVGDRPLDV